MNFRLVLLVSVMNSLVLATGRGHSLHGLAVVVASRKLNGLDERLQRSRLPVLGRRRHALVDRVEQPRRVLHLLLNDGPQLLNEQTQAEALLLCLLDLLREKLLTILQQLHELLVLGLELFDLVQTALLLFDILGDDSLLLGQSRVYQIERRAGILAINACRVITARHVAQC